MIAFNCKPLSANSGVEPLVFEWDERSGTVTGPGAALVKALAADGGVPLHPAPAWHAFGAEPLKSRADLAAIVGHVIEQLVRGGAVVDEARDVPEDHSRALVVPAVARLTAPRPRPNTIPA